MKAVMYHYVRKKDTGFPYFKNLDVEDFKRQLDYFEKHFGFASKEDFGKALKGEKNSDSVLLTFDDGLKDHFEFVLPILRERGLWGIFYIPTMMYESREFLNVHKTHLLLGKFEGKEIYNKLLTSIEDEFLTHRHVKEFREQTYLDQINDDYSLLVKRTLNYFIDVNWKGRVLDALMKEFFGDGSGLWDSFYLTKKEILALHHAGMIIGSHTVTHPVMSHLTIEDQEKEIKNSFSFLKNIVGEFSLKTFCYPYGGFHSFTSETEYLLRKAGCEFSFNVETRDIENSDLLNREQALPRYDCNHFPFGQCRDLAKQKVLEANG